MAGHCTACFSSSALRRSLLCAFCVALSQAAPPHPHGVGHVSLKETALIAPNNNHQKGQDCVKKWMTPGHAQFVDHNPHVQTPEIVDKQSHTFWLKPEADHCQTPAPNGRPLQYIYDSRQSGGGAAFVNCSLQTPDRMQYSPEIKKFTYYTFTEGSCATCDNCQGCTHGSATKVKDCTRKPDEPNKGVFQCDPNVANNWEVFPQPEKWFFAYFEEYKRTIGRVTLLGKEGDFGVKKGRASFGAKLASVMIWTSAMTGQAVNSLANGHLPTARHPVVAYVGDYAHDQNYNGGLTGSRWPRAPELGAEATIEESPPTESFAKGALHYEGGLPPCIHYFTAAPFKSRLDAAGNALPEPSTKDGDGDYGPYGEGAAADPATAAIPAPQRE